MQYAFFFRLNYYFLYLLYFAQRSLPPTHAPNLTTLPKHRLDDIVIFSPLSRKQLLSIMQLQMAAISNRLKDRNIEIHLTENGLDHVLAKAYVPEVRFDLGVGLLVLR